MSLLKLSELWDRSSFFICTWRGIIYAVIMFCINNNLLIHKLTILIDYLVKDLYFS